MQEIGVVRIINYITGQEVYSKNPEKTVKEMLKYHNSTFARNGEIHYPENAIAEKLDDVYVIRKQKGL